VSIPVRGPAGLPERLDGDETLVMGVLNVTPDSFSDGGMHDRAPDAIAHGRRLVAQGAAIVDIGGESTRPGAPRVDEEEELRRVIPVVEALAAEDVVISVDTMRASVAAASIAAGALIGR
jgi:dihydropteroate synthase